MKREIKFKLVFETGIGMYRTSKGYTLKDLLNFRYGLDDLLEEETEHFYHIDHEAFFSIEPKLVGKRQFTGGIDLHGEEIYEGDLIRGGMFLEYEVKWDTFSWNLGDMYNIRNNYEIIGNIDERGRINE